MNFKNRIIGSGTETVSNIVANPKNFRKHPKAQSNALSGVLDQVGWVQQVIINKSTGNLLDGHLRVEIAKANQEETIPVIYVELTTDEEALVLATIDPIGAMATIDKGNIEKLLGEINTQVAIDERLADFVKSFAKQQGINMDGEPTNSEPQIDRAEEINQKWKVKSGDLWQIGEHRLLCGDSCKAEDVARVMGGGKAYAVVTDPPYNVGIEYGSGVNDSKTIKENEKFISKWFKLWKDTKLKIITPGAGYYLGTLRSWLTIFPPTWMCMWIRKNSMSHSPLRGFASWEPVLYYDIEEDQPDWGGVLVYGKVKKPIGQDIFDIPVRVQKAVEDIDGNKLHPTPKPVELFFLILQKFTTDGDIVADPFLGSGTTMVACQNLNRKCRGIEVSPNYCAVILERMATAFPDIDIKKI